MRRSHLLRVGVECPGPPSDPVPPAVAAALSRSKAAPWWATPADVNTTCVKRHPRLSVQEQLKLRACTHGGGVDRTQGCNEPAQYSSCGNRARGFVHAHCKRWSCIDGPCWEAILAPIRDAPGRASVGLHKAPKLFNSCLLIPLQSCVDRRFLISIRIELQDLGLITLRRPHPCVNEDLRVGQESHDLGAVLPNVCAMKFSLMVVVQVGQGLCNCCGHRRCRRPRPLISSTESTSQKSETSAQTKSRINSPCMLIVRCD
mmetsp:Transcript_73369/g.185256  ORF Transcript_73369/g.185256 Transcript_73369/m.185256 type:complete len:259 (-) Transcript_73369:693-1469(-)